MVIVVPKPNPKPYLRLEPLPPSADVLQLLKAIFAANTKYKLMSVQYEQKKTRFQHGVTVRTDRLINIPYYIDFLHIQRKFPRDRPMQESKNSSRVSM